VLAADPTAARKRKEEAQRQARVERWTEPAGTAALAGRDLPPASVLVADANLTALASQLKAAGVPGTMDALRAQVYLALLTGAPVTSLLPCPGGAAHDETGGDQYDRTSPTARVGAPVSAAPPGAFSSFGGLTGSVNLTVPLATWLGLADIPGHAAGYGPLDATNCRTLAAALAAQASSKWCLTVTGPDGRPVAHGCARPGPSPGRRRSRAAIRTRDRPTAGSRDGPEARARNRTWTVTLTCLDRGRCDHAWETAGYQPSPGLRHLVQIRHATCTFPGCRRPATQCDADHTLAYDHGGRTCLCNLAPLCRHHHQVKQSRGWTLQQASPGVLTWTTPAGRRHTITSTSYPS
jgi:hypothetical protein